MLQVFKAWCSHFYMPKAWKWVWLAKKKIRLAWKSWFAIMALGGKSLCMWNGERNATIWQRLKMPKWMTWFYFRASFAREDHCYSSMKLKFAQVSHLRVTFQWIELLSVTMCLKYWLLPKLRLKQLVLTLNVLKQLDQYIFKIAYYVCHYWKKLHNNKPSSSNVCECVCVWETGLLSLNGHTDLRPVQKHRSIKHHCEFITLLFERG